jgi:hypothetical protein
VELTDPDKPAKKKEPPRCSSCGGEGEYRVDIYGIHSEDWHCRDCHEQACRQKVRHDYWHRYGY